MEVDNEKRKGERGKRVSADGLPGGKTVEVDVDTRRERERDVSKTVEVERCQ